MHYFGDIQAVLEGFIEFRIYSLKGNITPAAENQMDKKMDIECELGLCGGFI